MGNISWCPGCGNYPILDSLNKAVEELGIARNKLVLVSGIGQAAKTPHYFTANAFNGLHGRAIPPATAIKASNPELTVIITSGDGDMYGEGGNHFIHAIRRNPDITCMVHNNLVYGLTKGQASPTSPVGFKTPMQVYGVSSTPFNPIAVAVALGASFVARGFSGDKEMLKDFMKMAISHKGFSLLDIFQPCVSFNKIHTYKWFRENTYYLDDSYDPKDHAGALLKSLETEKLPLGVIYKSAIKPVFEENLGIYGGNFSSLYQRRADDKKLEELFESTKK